MNHYLRLERFWLCVCSNAMLCMYLPISQYVHIYVLTVRTEHNRIYSDAAMRAYHTHTHTHLLRCTTKKNQFINNINITSHPSFLPEPGNNCNFAGKTKHIPCSRNPPNDDIVLIIRLRLIRFPCQPLRGTWCTWSPTNWLRGVQCVVVAGRYTQQYTQQQKTTALCSCRVCVQVSPPNSDNLYVVDTAVASRTHKHTHTHTPDHGYSTRHSNIKCQRTDTNTTSTHLSLTSDVHLKCVCVCGGRGGQQL